MSVFSRRQKAENKSVLQLLASMMFQVSAAQPARLRFRFAQATTGASFASLASLGQAKLGGGAERDRTDDLKLAKLALSQLSYGP
jgi:hypothetical protein